MNQIQASSQTSETRVGLRLAKQHEQYQQHQQHRAACSSISYSSSSSIRILQQQRNRAASAESSSAASIVQQHHQQHGALHTLPPTSVSPLTATQKPQPPLNATWAGKSVAGVRTRMQRARGGGNRLTRRGEVGIPPNRRGTTPPTHPPHSSPLARVKAAQESASRTLRENSVPSAP
ncbi:unnamed protein product [Lampetra planeri]